jgi:hypothetical protein
MNICYSNRDISQKLGGNVRVITYKELLNYKTLDEALGEHGAFIVLYEQERNFGHWCCGFLDDDIFYFFDSYGIIPDDQLIDIDPKFRIKSGQQFKYLTYLMKNSPYEIDYNPYQFQDDQEGINTCGRWCVARIKNKDLDADEFYDLFTGDNIDSDELVVEYTDDI